VRRDIPPDVEFPVVLLVVVLIAALALLVVTVVNEVTVVTDEVAPNCGLFELSIGLWRLFALLLNGL